MVTANVTFIKAGETVIYYHFEDGASLPRIGETVHLGDAGGNHKVTDVVRNYGAYDDGDTVDGGDEIFIHVTEV